MDSESIAPISGSSTNSCIDILRIFLALLNSLILLERDSANEHKAIIDKGIKIRNKIPMTYHNGCMSATSFVPQINPGSV